MRLALPHSGHGDYAQLLMDFQTVPAAHSEGFRPVSDAALTIS